ncbi:MAG: hypothetical protein AB7T49_19130 [Oligoflexales bacterium]
MLQQYIGILILGILSVNCKKIDDSSSKSDDEGGSFSITKKGLIAAINDESSFYSKEPQETALSLVSSQTVRSWRLHGFGLQSPASNQNCLEAYVDTQKPPTLVATAAEMSYTWPLTYTCTDSDQTTRTLTFETVAKISCAGLDLSQYNGKALEDMPDETFNTCGPGSKSSFTVERTSVEKNLAESYSGESHSTETETCDFSSTQKICELTSADTSHSSGNGSIDRYAVKSKISINATRANGSDLYFSGGNATFTFNNWTGTLTYTGATTPPTWTATNNKGAQASGTFGSSGESVAPTTPSPTPSTNGNSTTAPAPSDSGTTGTTGDDSGGLEE